MRTALTVSFALVLALGLTSCCCIDGFDLDMEGYKSEFERTYDFDAGGKVVVKNVDGLVHVDSWDKNEVLVKGTLRVRAKSEEEARNRMKEIKVVVTQDDGVLSIEIKRKKKRPGVWFEYSRWRVDLELTVPRDTDLSVSTVDGSVRVVEVDGNHQLKTVDGSVHAESVKGDVKAHSVDGSCTVIDIEGDVDVSTTDGSIEVTGVRGDVECESVDGSCTLADLNGGVSASTVDGRIRIQGVLSDLTATATNGSIGIAALEGSAVSEKWEISSVDGSVTIMLPESLSADLRASTVDGRVSLSFPAEFQLKNKRSVVATLGEGGGVISVSTTDGSIRVRSLEVE